MKKSKFTYEELYNYFIVENHTLKELSEHFNKARIDRDLDFYGIKKSPKLVGERSKQTKLNKYGKVAVNMEKAAETKLLKYDDPNYNNVEKNKQTKFERHGNENYNNYEKCLQTVRLNWGEDNMFNREKAVATCKERWPKDNYNNREQAKQTCLKTLGVDNPTKSAEVHKKMHKKYVVDNESFDSSWEVTIWNYCKRHNLICKHLIEIPYTYDNKDHVTLIDFKIDNQLVECKGDHLLNGCYNGKTNVPIEAKINVYKENNVLLVTSKFIKMFEENKPWKEIVYALQSNEL